MAHKSRALTKYRAGEVHSSGRGRWIATLLLSLAIAVAVSAENLDKEMANITEKIGKGLIAKQKTKIAVADFTDLEGRPNEFGRFLAEQLSVDFVNVPGLSVVDRAHLKSILAEHKLSEDGLINPETAKQLGRFAGVDAILIGTITSLDDSVALTVKAISTETAEILAATKVSFPRNKDVEQLGSLAIGVEANPKDTVAKYSPPSDIVATKDFGDLRVVTKKISRVKVTDGYGPPTDSFYCAFEFTNRNTKDALRIAANGELNSITQPHSQLRTSAGTVLAAAEVRGLSIVSVYGEGSPEAIAQAVMSGRKMEDTHGYYYNGEKIWEGEFGTLAPGETLSVTLIFKPDFRQPRDLPNVDDAYLDFQFVMGVSGHNNPNPSAPTVKFGGRSAGTGPVKLYNLSIPSIPVSTRG